jgi:hypothetical protein
MPCPLCKTELTLHSIEYIGNELWEELHMMESPTEAEFTEWLDRVPSFGCQCRHHANNFIDMDPVDYESFPAWAGRFHNHINRCTGKPKWESSTAGQGQSSESVAVPDVTPSPEIDTVSDTEESDSVEPDPQPQ